MTNPDTRPMVPPQALVLHGKRLLEFILAVVCLAWLTGLPFYFDVEILTPAYLLAVTGLGTALGFIHKPYRERFAYWELLPVFLSLAAWGWGAWHFADWKLDIINRGLDKTVPAVIALALLIEATRKKCGNAIALILVLCVVLGLTTDLYAALINVPTVLKSLFLVYLYTDTNGVPGIVLNVAATIVLTYLFLGVILSHVGASTFFTDLALLLMGRRRGGPAKVAVCASSLFGTISGSTVANIMTVGVVTIPLMKNTGFPARVAAGIEAVASNGGQLAPPVMGTTAFLIAEFLQIPYARVVEAALLPAIIYYFVLFLQVDLVAKDLKLAGMPEEQLPKLRSIGIRWLFAIPLLGLVLFLFILGYSAEDSGLYTAALALGCGWIVKRHIGLGMFYKILVNVGESFVILLLICAAAGIIIGTLNITGIGFVLTNALTAVGQHAGSFALLVVTAIIAIVLGMGMPTAAVYVVLSVLLSPALVDLGITPLAANMFIFYFGLLSMLTPPVAIAAYAAGAIAETSLWDVGVTGFKMAIAGFVLPFVFVYNTALLGIGSPLAIASSFISVTVASYLLAKLITGTLGTVPSTLPAGRIGLQRAGLLLGTVVVGGAGIVLEPDNLLAVVPALLVMAYLYWRRRSQAAGGAI